MTSETRRLHPVAAFTHALSALRDLAIPIVVGALAGSGGVGAQALVIGLAGAGLSAAIGIVRWNTTTYRLSERALHFRSGVFSPDETVVPIDRVQSVDTIAGPVQRLFGVTGLRVQTPGGGEEAEIELSALSDGDVRAVREALRHPESDTAAAPRRRLTAGGLLLTALTAPQITVLAPVFGLLGAAAQDQLVDIGFLERLGRRLDDPGHVALAVVLIVGAAWVVSFAGAVVAFAGFEAARVDDRLRIRRGLLQRRAVTVPVARIDGVVLAEGLLRRPFGRGSLRLEVASRGQEATAARVLFPLLRREDAEPFLRELLPELAVAMEPHERPPRRALRRYLTPLIVLAVVASVALVIAAPAAWPAAPVLIAAALAAGLDAFAATGLRVAPHHVVLRTWRRGARLTLAARVHRLQEHGTSVNPLQRRAALAHVEVRVGSGTRMRARHVGSETAAAFLSRLRA